MNIIKDLILNLSESYKTQPILSEGENSCHYNIFSVLGIETKEVIICRFIGDLLDPKGSHKMGCLPIKLFAEEVLHTSITELEAQNAAVFLEEKIDNDRRVDIVIRIASKVFPIEVKVWACDQDAQLSDYFYYYNSERIYYLTPTGWKPTDRSRKNLTVGKEIICLSFQDDINKWLSDICKYASLNVKDIIDQFIEVIKVMCNKNKKFELLKDALKLNDKLDIDITLKATIDLLSNADALLKEIRIKYLLEHLTVNSKYSLDLCEKEDLKFDSHALLRVRDNSTNKIVAWICVQDNLYMVAQKVKNKEIWDKSHKDNYYWQYIKPKNFEKKAFPMKDLSEINNTDEINIEWLLNDVEI